ncbi:MAG: hypothetical protein K6E41_04475 [Solobacterium sp.]|nr:hypothetical protein [Solobacterium sp.]
MIRGTTPTMKFTFSEISTSDIMTAYMTIKQNGGTTIEKDLSQAEVGDGYLEWTLTQEDTLKLNARNVVNIQLRCRTSSGAAYTSEIFESTVGDILKDGVI